jgi:hypothetical protein
MLSYLDKIWTDQQPNIVKLIKKVIACHLQPSEYRPLFQKPVQKEVSNVKEGVYLRKSVHR